MELPKFARIIKNEQVTLCSVFNKYHSFTIFQQLAEDEERIFEVLLFLFFTASKRVWKLLFPYYLADRFRTLSRLTMIKNQQRSYQNHRSRQQTPQPKPPWVCSVGACSWCCRNLENTNKLSEKIGLTVARGNRWRKWVVQTIFFISTHSFTTSKTNLMKRQDCSAAPYTGRN